MFFKIISYLKFLFKSKNQHRVHSPFIFNFITKALYKKLSVSEIGELQRYKRALLKNHSKITVIDFGAGSQIFSSNHREISKIAQHVSISLKRSQLLYKTVQYFQPSYILEIGTSLGVATSVLALGAPKAKIITLEGCLNTSKVAQEQLKKHGYSNIEFVVGNFKETLPKVLKNNCFDLVYFDGNHTKQATLNYFQQCLQCAHNDSVFIFDDIHWSKDMTEAWEEIQKHEMVRVTIDTYQWGLVFFRKEQQKEHFTIRV